MGGQPLADGVWLDRWRWMGEGFAFGRPGIEAKVQDVVQSLSATARAKARKSSRWREQTLWTMLQLMRS